jgi:hypothetical protein
MRITLLSRGERAALLQDLEAMPAFLRATLGRLTPAQAALPGPGGSFSPAEQAWHLADLEREGYAVRIRRLLEEERPRLADFDGARIARERGYRSLSLLEGIAAFESARRENLAQLRGVRGDAWSREGTQEGIGAVALCDLPALMGEHDRGHRAEIREWLEAVGLAGSEEPA